MHVFDPLGQNQLFFPRPSLAASFDDPFSPQQYQPHTHPVPYTTNLMILVKASLALVTLVAPSIVRAGVSPITRIGNKLFDATGQRFFIKVRNDIRASTGELRPALVHCWIGGESWA